MDCLILIFNQADEGTLYSCLLVNKEWCSVIVPILWKKFSWYGHESRLWKCSNDDSETDRKLYNTILSCLQISSKQLLPDNGVKLSSTIISSSPLFDYISFCKFPTALTINVIIKIVKCPAESCNYLNKKFTNYLLVNVNVIILKNYVGILHNPYHYFLERQYASQNSIIYILILVLYILMLYMRWHKFAKV